MNNIWRRVFLLVLIGLAMPLLADSPEYLVGSTVVTPAPNGRGLTAMATDGTDFFVVWADGRAESRASLVGTRVTRSGRVLDPLGIRIVMTSAVQYPNVVWDGGAYLVTWTAGWEDGAVYAARVDRDGRIVMAPRVIAADAMVTSGRYVATNGNVTVVAYRSFDSRAPSRVAVLDREGNVLHHETISTAAQPYQSGLSVAASASHFVVVWSAFLNNQIQTATVHAVALSADGRVEKGPVPIGTGDAPAIASDGTRFLVVSHQWQEPKWHLLSRVVNASLTQTGATQTLTSAFNLDAPSLLWRGNHYEIVAGRRETVSHDSHLYSIEVGADGNKLTERSRGPIAPPYASASPVALASGSDLFVALTTPVQDPSFAAQIFGRLYRGTSNDPDVHELLSWSGNAHDHPAVASSAAGQFVAWSEEDGVYATRIDAQGLSIDGRGIRISNVFARPHVAFNGTSYVVAWSENSMLSVRYVSPATGAIVAQAQVPAQWVNAFTMTASAEATYLAYAAFEDQRLHVTRIPHATHTPDPVPLVVSPEEMLVESPALAWNGSTLLVAWNEIVIPRGDPPIAIAVKVLAARVTAGLTLLDPAPLLLAETDEETWSTFGAPSLASNGEDWLVVTDVDARDVLARRVRRNGTVEGSGPVKIADGFGPVVAFDGTRYVVAWRTGASWPPDNPLLLAAVPASGALAATRRTLVSTHLALDPPSIAPAAGGEIAVVYTKLSFAPEHTGVNRSYLRRIDLASQRGRVVRR